MTVSELIAKLREMPQDLPVSCVYDTFIVQAVDFAWVNAGGDEVLLCVSGHPISSRDLWPSGVTVAEYPNDYWNVP